jgi:hypothetical protein
MPVQAVGGATTKFMESGTDATGGLEFWSSNTGCSSTTAVSNTGPRSINCNTGGGATTAYVTANNVLADSGRRISFYMRVSSNSALIDILRMTGGVGSNILGMDGAGKLRLVLGSSGTIVGSTTLSINTWHHITLTYTITSSSVNQVKLYLDDNSTPEITATNTSGASTGNSNLNIGWPFSVNGANRDIWLDDIYIDDSSALTDTGSVHVTAKLPNANSTNQFDLAIGNNPANRWTNVNERPLSTTNGWRQSALPSQFGFNAAGGSTKALNANTMRFSKFTAPSNTSGISSISAYLNRTATGGSYAVDAGIYTDSSGAPSTLVTNSQITLSSNINRNSPQWYTANYSTAPSLTPNSTYWLGVIAAKASVTYFDSGSSNQEASKSQTYGTLPNSFGSPTYANNKMSVYISYNPTITSVESYGIEGASAGDVDLTNQLIVARESWLWAKNASISATGNKIINNGAETSITLTTSPAIYTDIVDSSSYPSNSAAVGLRSSFSGDDYLYECGMLIAYVPIVISVSVSDGSVSYGTLSTNTSSNTTSSGLNDTQAATNDGNVAEDFNIKGQSSANWTLSATSGSNQYSHQFCKTGSGSPDPCDASPTWTSLTTSYQQLASNIAASSNQRFDLKINTPTSTAATAQQSVDVTVQAVLH